MMRIFDCFSSYALTLSIHNRTNGIRQTSGGKFSKETVAVKNVITVVTASNDCDLCSLMLLATSLRNG